MAVETAADRAAMLAVDDGFGVSASHINEYGVESTLTGIFDNQYFAADTGISGVAFAESNPTFLGRTEDFTDIRYGDRLEIGAVVWVIREIMPDGTGFTELTLERGE